MKKILQLTTVKFVTGSPELYGGIRLTGIVWVGSSLLSQLSAELRMVTSEKRHLSQVSERSINVVCQIK